MKVLVTGATGFVGNHLLKELKDKYSVNILVRKNISGGGVFLGDLSNRNVLLEASKVDVVVHLAGTDKGDVFNVNYQGTKNLVDACVENKIKKFIFVSSYDSTLDTEYGKSKLQAEEYLKNSGLKYIIFRPTVIYGKNNKRDLGKIIQLIKIGVAPVPGNGSFKLQPLFIDDFISLLVKAIESKNEDKTYFVGGGSELSFNDLINSISSCLGKKVVKIRIPGFLIKLRNKTLLKDKVCDNSEVENDFDFHPRIFEDALKEIIS